MDNIDSSEFPETSPTIVHAISAQSNIFDFENSSSDREMIDSLGYFSPTQFFSLPTHRKKIQRKLKGRKSQNVIRFKPFESSLSAQNMVETIRSIMKLNDK
jgi:isopenicillin N synthase-like dioxygenase